jgi:divalent metal cation (Fe/Co/Zn/Cd) transporter
MTDKAASDSIEAEIRLCIMFQKDVIGIDLLKTRLFGNRIYVEVEIIVDGCKPLRIAHEIAQTVHDAIETEFPKVKHCTVHVNPDN